MNSIRHEARFIKQIVRKILNELKSTTLHIARYPIGLDSRVIWFNKRLNDGSDGVRFVGICGMGGIGKTTLAKAVYNQFFHTFESKCFLANVREDCGKPDRLVSLQEQLISDALKLEKVKISNVHQGVDFIKKRLCTRRVLIVLDDLDHLNQLRVLAGEPEWFGSGSRIIITTRNIELLKEIEADVYIACGLDNEESLQFFSLHAFKRCYPKEEFTELSEAIISYCSGVPLALEVLGSHLCDRRVEEWKSALDKLKRIPSNSIQAQLRLSYDAHSDDMERTLFLDIACFFVGWDAQYAIKILDGCCFFAELGISILRDRCLLQISGGSILMHALLRDMGREIVREESANYPGKRSRLWFDEDVLTILRNYQGREEVEGIALSLLTSNELNVSAEAFARMSRLRILQLNNVKVRGQYGLISKELRWLYWHRFCLQFIPDEFYLENIVTIDMQYSNLRQLWKHDKFLGNLKILNLSYSHLLNKTPDFLKFPNLEELILIDCVELAEIQGSIGHLERLVLVKLKDCRKLRNLPDSISKVKSLRILDISGCSKIDRLPDDFGEITSMTEFKADGTGIRQLPSSVARLKNLTTLSLCGCKASNSGVISSLIWSWVSRQQLAESNNRLITSLAGLSSLEILRLRDCNLSDDTIPEGIGSLPFLRELDLSQNNFRHLPAAISCLRLLRNLKLDDCKMLKTVQNTPPSLDVLSAENCASLERAVIFSNRARLRNCPCLAEVNLDDDCKLWHEVLLEGRTNISTNCKGVTLKGMFSRADGENSYLVLPGGDIPDWFSYQSTSPASLSIHIPPEQHHKLKDSVTVCVVYETETENDVLPRYISLIVTFKTRQSELCFLGQTNCFGGIPFTYGDHMWIQRFSSQNISEGVEGEDVVVEVVSLCIGSVKVKRLGLHFGSLTSIYDDDGLCAAGSMMVDTCTSRKMISCEFDSTADHAYPVEDHKNLQTGADEVGVVHGGSLEENRALKKMRIEHST